MRRVLLAAVVVSLLAPASASARVCVPPGYQVVKEGHHARVVKGRHGVHFGCLFRRDRLVELDGPEDPATPSEAARFRLAGRFVAYELTSYDADDYGVGVHSVDLGDGRTAHRTDAGDDQHDEVAQLRVSRRGSIAWVACDWDRCGRRSRLEVRRSDSRGEELLDRGRGIEPASLRLRRDGTRVTWNHGNRHPHASLR